MVSSGEKPPVRPRPGSPSARSRSRPDDRSAATVSTDFEEAERTLVWDPSPFSPEPPEGKPAAESPAPVRVEPAHGHGGGPSVTRSRRSAGQALAPPPPRPRSERASPPGSKGPAATAQPVRDEPDRDGPARSGRPRLRLPGFEDRADPSQRTPSHPEPERFEAKRFAFESGLPPPTGASPTQRIEVPIISSGLPDSGARLAGGLSGLAVAVVVVVGFVFVRGTQDPQAELDARARPKPARERVSPSRIRTWQDAFRAEHPELLVASPKLAPLPIPPRDRLEAYEPFTPGPGRAPASFWTPERVAETELPGLGLPGGSVVTPRYPGLSPADLPPELPPMVVIESIPPGARVVVDDEVFGLTPLMVPAGPAVAGTRVELSMPGFRTIRGQLTEAADGQWVFKAKLEPK